MNTKPARIGFANVWQEAPTCESCPLFIQHSTEFMEYRRKNALAAKDLNGADVPINDGLCCKDPERREVCGEIHWCGSHPAHAAMLAIQARAAAQKIAAPTTQNGIVKPGGFRL